MKRFNLLLYFCFILSPLMAQDHAVQGLYRQVPLIINPGRTGLSDGMRISTVYRRQLSGFEGGPNLQFIGLEKGFSRNRIGLAFNLAQDNNGPLKTSLAEGIFAYHISFDNQSVENSNNYVSIGIAPAFRHYRLSMEDINGDLSDPVLSLIEGSQAEFNASFGFFLFYEGFELGISGFNLVIGEQKILSGLRSQNLLPRGSLFLGYAYPVDKSFSIHPYLNFTAQFNGEFATDLNLDAKITINEQNSLDIGGGVRYAYRWKTGFPEVMMLFAGYSFGPFSFAYQFNRPISTGNGIYPVDHIFSLHFSKFGGKNKSSSKPDSWFK